MPTTSAGASRWSSARPSRTRSASSRATRCSWSPARRAASSPRSPPIWPRPPGRTFHLLDLVPEPDASDPDLDRFVSDTDGLKRELAERIKQRGERPTPKLVERELAAHRACARRAGRDRGDPRRRRHGALAPVRPHRPGSGPGGAGRCARGRARGRADALRRASRSATSCPTSRSASTTSSST